MQSMHAAMSGVWHRAAAVVLTRDIASPHDSTKRARSFRTTDLHHDAQDCIQGMLASDAPAVWITRLHVHYAESVGEAALKDFMR